MTYIGEPISDLESAEPKLSSRKTGQGRAGQYKRHLVLGYTNPGLQVSLAVTFCTSARKFAGIAQSV
jgi:hypothetical protein